jgi:hypothetical protein
MTEHLTLPTVTELAQTKSKQSQAMKNTVSNLTNINHSETTQERNRTDNDKHNS